MNCHPQNENVQGGACVYLISALALPFRAIAAFCMKGRIQYLQKMLSDLSCADSVTLEVRKSNAAAIALYESFGFERVGERRGFYEKPTEDALLMTKILNGET